MQDGFPFFAILGALLLGAVLETRADLNPGALDWRWDAKLAHWGTSVYGALNELDRQADLDRRADELAAMGITVVMIDGLHMRNSFMDQMPRAKAYVRRVTDACHARGIKVIEHHSATILIYGSYTGYGVRWMAERPDLLQRDIQYGYALKTPCINNPAFRRHYFGFLTNYLAETGVDAFMLDEAHFSGSRACGCPHCRARFKQDTGFEIPDDDTDPFFRFDTAKDCLTNLDDRRVIAFLEWRDAAVTAFFAAARHELDKVKPAVSLMIYTTHYGLTSRFDMQNGSGTIFSKSKVCDWTGTEIMTRNLYADARSVFFMRKAMGALGLSARTPVFAFVYHMDNPDMAKMGWAIQRMHGQTAIMDTIAAADMRYVDWPDRMNPRLAESSADIALVFSDSTRKWGRAVAYLPDLGGWSQCLTDAHLLHDIVLDRDLAPDRLAKYRLVLLPSVSCLSEAQMDALRTYVRKGGRILVTGPTSMQDELGFMRKDFGLADMLGIRFEGASPAGRILNWNANPVVLDQVGTKARVIDTNRVQVLAWNQSGPHPTTPGITAAPWGDGWIFYDANRLGIYNMAFEGRLGKPRLVTRNDALRQAAVDLVRQACGGALRFEASPAVPAKVMMSVFTEQRDGQSRMRVHLLNATGVPDVQAGETLTVAMPSDPWPALKEDLSFTVSLPGYLDGRVVSPEFQGSRPIRVTSDGMRRTVTVAKEDLHWYSTVELTIAKEPQP